MSNKEYMTRTIITAGKRWFQGDEEMIEIQVASWEPRSYVHRSISVIDDDMIRHYIEEGDMCFV
ncbi:hypothetical protein, partial [Streptomyces europaeiscabiei]|uniref:hypothetical protein n=1 Tax=Streptomyces europaeiscabiei TaxID=146819 RepID=UPI0038F73C98